MCENTFLKLDHEETLALLVFLRRREADLDDRLMAVQMKAERELFAVHSIEEMEKLVDGTSVKGIGR
ncbi:MAG: hypothetical protein EA427_07265 [Spirochaetaceae bacterium]|nr:MAG: hypothetical protein EA427_07265 [Spirochaetaceae bacterium]